MKKKIILGLLLVVAVLIFVTSSWGLDAKRAKLYGHPDQELEKVPVMPQTIIAPSMTKIIIIPNRQNVPVLIYIDKLQVKTQVKAEDLTKNSTTSLNKTR